jgi:hypothetical protein
MGLWTQVAIVFHEVCNSFAYGCHFFFFWHSATDFCHNLLYDSNNSTFYLDGDCGQLGPGLRCLIGMCDFGAL